MAQQRKSSSYHHGNLREACIKEGARLLNKAGPEQLSLRDISRRLNVSPGAPYRHFKGREHLLAAIASWGFQELAAYMKEGVESSPARCEDLRAMGHSFLEFAKDQPEVFKLMFSGFAVKHDEDGELKKSGEETYGLLFSCVDGLIKEGLFKEVETQRVSVHALAMIYGYSLLLLNGQLENLTIEGKAAHLMLDAMTDDMIQGLQATSSTNLG